MLRDIIAECIAKEPDMEVIAGVLDPTSLTRSDVSMEVEVVVFGSDDPFRVRALLAQRPQLKIFAVANHGRESSHYVMRPQRVPLGEISPQRLIEEIRKVTQGEVDA